MSSFSNHTQTVDSLPVPLISLVVLDCELVRGAESEILADLVPRVQQQSLALDLAQVNRIDASGIATLITLYCTSVESGTHFSVVNPSNHVLELLRIVGLESILVSYDLLTESYDQEQSLLEPAYSAA